MNVLISLLSAAVACLTVVSCSKDDSARTSGELNASTYAGPNILYWQDAGQMFRATCEVDKPANRTNCTGNTTQLTAAELTSRANQLGSSTLNVANVSIAAEIKALKDADPSVASLNQQIASMIKQKTDLQTVVTDDGKLLDAAAKEKALSDEKVALDDQELAEIAKELQKTPGDSLLLELQAKLRQERQEHASLSAVIAARMQTIQKHMNSQQTTSTALDQQIKLRQDELKKTYDELVVYSAKLEQLTSAKTTTQQAVSNVPSVLNLINRSDVAFQGNTLNSTMQSALLIVDRAFEPAMAMTFGRYKVESGFSRFCPQKIEPVIQAGEVRIDITPLAPCNPIRVSYLCEKETCKVSATRYFTVMNGTHYTYVEGANKAVFILDSAE